MRINEQWSVTWKDLTRYLREQTNIDNPDPYLWPIDPDDTAMAMFTECGSQMRLILFAIGIEYDDDAIYFGRNCKGLAFTMEERLSAAELLSSSVSEAYNRPNQYHAIKQEDKIWNEWWTFLGCGGDDSVDYTGTYLDHLWYAIRNYRSSLRTDH